MIDALATTMTGNSATSDMDVMEIEASNSAAVNVPAAAPLDSARGFLTVARQLFDEGKPCQALQAVIMATKMKSGEAAVFQILQRARELYVNRLQTGAQADQLASLFADCVITEAHPPRTDSLSVPKPTSTTMQSQSNLPLAPCPDAYGTSILAESGRKQVVLDAFADGSSFICLKCGGLVSNHRKDEHFAYWCQS